MKLYKISEQFRSLQSLFDDEMIDAQSFGDTLESMKAEFADKALNCVFMIREYKMLLSEASEEKARIAAFEKKQQSAIDQIEDYLRDNMTATNQEKISLGVHGLTLKKASLKLPAEINETEIPKEFFKVVPETKTLDRVALLSAVKTGKVNIELVEGKRALLIK